METLRQLEQFSGPITRRDAVVDSLRDAIVTGALQPGVFLRETALALRLGVSATPVREAMAALAAEGLVEIEVHRHKRVAPIDLNATRDLLEVQSHLWRLGYQMGVSRIDRPRIDTLRRHVADYRDALGSVPDPLAAIRASHAFHTSVISASANTELLRVTLDRRSLVARFIFLRGGATTSHSGLRLHEEILSAIEWGDESQALGHFDSLAARMIALADPHDGAVSLSGD